MSCFSTCARSAADVGSGIGGLERLGHQSDHVGILGAAADGDHVAAVEHVGHAALGAGLALARLPARRLGNLGSLEHPALQAVADDALAQPVAEDIGQVVPAELEDVAWVFLAHPLDDGLDAAGDEQRRCHSSGDECGQHLGRALAADGQDDQVRVLLLEVGDHRGQWRPDRSCCSCRVKRWSAMRLTSSELLRPSARLVLNSWSLSPTNAGRWMSRALMKAAITGTRSSSCEGRIVNTLACFSKMLLTEMSDRNGMPLVADLGADRVEHRLGTVGLREADHGDGVGVGERLLHVGDGARVVLLVVEELRAPSLRRRMPPSALMRFCSALVSCSMAATMPLS